MTMEVGGTIAGNGRNPTGKVVGIAQGGKLGEGLEKDVLYEVFDVMGRDTSEENAVDHAGVPGIEKAVGGAVAALGGTDQGRVRRGGRIEPGIHGCDASWRRSELIESGHGSFVE